MTFCVLVEFRSLSVSSKVSVLRYDFPNEADSWYWDLFSAGTTSYNVDLPDPVIEAGQTATYTIELMTREYLQYRLYEVDTCLNSLSECTERSWAGHKNVNVVETVPVTSLVSGTNEFTVTLSGSSGVQAYLNRITVDYLRILKAQDDQLFFTDGTGGRASMPSAPYPTSRCEGSHKTGKLTGEGHGRGPP